MTCSAETHEATKASLPLFLKHADLLAVQHLFPGEPAMVFGNCIHGCGSTIVIEVPEADL